MKRWVPAFLGTVLLMIFGLFAAAQVGSKPQLQGNDWLLIPERRAGPITGEWTGEDLMRAFGTLHCQRADIPVGEGFTEPGYRLYAGTDDEATVLMSEDGGSVDRVIVQIRFEDIKDQSGNWIGRRPVPRTSPWHSLSGISLGSPIPKVEEVNGGPFGLESWEIDYPGVVTDWRNGKIPDSFRVRFMYSDEEVYSRWWQRVMSGGAAFDGSSDNAGIRSLNPTVYHIEIQL